MADHQQDGTASMPKNVIIIGGSLSGLMHGLMLHHLGCTVRILEQSPTDTLVSHMAGVCLTADVQTLVARFDRAREIPLGIPCVRMQKIDMEGKPHPVMRINRLMTSWDALYYRLRANFDSRVSAYVPHPPALVPRADESMEAAKNRATYDFGKQVVNIEQLKTGQLMVRYKDLKNGGKDGEAVADLVLGADGWNSVVRKTFGGPNQAERKYSGYVAWRGTVPEDQVSEATRNVFSENNSYLLLESAEGRGGHVIVYNIPGKDGSTQPGKRVLSFCWYTNIAESSLDNIMTDADGKRRRTHVPPGKIRCEVWEKQKAYARTAFAFPFLEVIEKITSPFVLLVTDYYSPRASFAGGKVLLVGDAATQLRPHLAYSTNQAAYHALLTEKLVTGQLSAEDWEYQVTTASYLHWRRALWFGEYFQRPLYVSIGSALHFWASSLLAVFRVWAGWLPEQAM
ncbi:hypothetical protein GGR53DRAFT_519795 [Hypoxylon sp. FL1150]|nr:hypothetical protein GGR53DRAFT_519795 [Hypoxylon sp. FL1150]